MKKILISLFLVLVLAFSGCGCNPATLLDFSQASLGESATVGYSETRTYNVTFAENYSSDVAKKYLSEGKIVVFGAGLGIPFLSTDTTGAVRAAEIEADAMFMAKNIDYIYTADPRKDPNAKKLETVKASDVLAWNLKAIDATATAFCLSTGMPIHIFGLKNPEDIVKAVEGNVKGTVVTAE